MIGNVYEYEDLQRIAGGRTVAQVCANLAAMGIRYKARPDGKPFTTLTHIEHSISPTGKVAVPQRQIVEV